MVQKPIIASFDDLVRMREGLCLGNLKINEISYMMITIDSYIVVDVCV